MNSRLFIAIDFPKKTKEEIGGLIKELAREYPQIRWEKKEKLHLTLKFLGWTEVNIKNQKSKGKITNQNSKIQKIIEGMERSVWGIKPFWFQPLGLGYFLHQSAVVWLGVKTQEGLFQIVKSLEEEMANLGFPKEKREFFPHITIGRVKRARPRKKWQKILSEIRNFKTPSFSQFKVKEVVLMESELTPEGSVYSLIKRTPLEPRLNLVN